MSETDKDKDHKQYLERKWGKVLEDLKKDVPLSEIKKRDPSKIIEVILPPYGT
jgi:hypothetical protein